VGWVVPAPEIEVVKEVASRLSQLAVFTNVFPSQLTQFSTRFQSLFEFLVATGLAEVVVLVTVSEDCGALQSLPPIAVVAVAPAVADAVELVNGC